jgi:hypothetical protein
MPLNKTETVGKPEVQRSFQALWHDSLCVSHLHEASLVRGASMLESIRAV